MGYGAILFSLSVFNLCVVSCVQIYSNDGLTQLGSINHQWDQVQNEYNISITFPSHRDDPKYKAIVIGAAFLLVISLYLRMRMFIQLDFICFRNTCISSTRKSQAAVVGVENLSLRIIFYYFLTFIK